MFARVYVSTFNSAELWHRCSILLQILPLLPSYCHRIVLDIFDERRPMCASSFAKQLEIGFDADIRGFLSCNVIVDSVITLLQLKF